MGSNNPTHIIKNKSVMAAVLALALPVVAQSLLQVLIGTVDLKMVGALGSDAIAAVGMGRQVIMIIMILVLAISTGATAIVARNIGRGNPKEAGRAAGNSFTLVLIFALFMTPLGLVTARHTLELLGASPEVMGPGLNYMYIFYASVVFFLANFMARAVFQGAGDTVTPLKIDIIMNITNVVFNYLLIYGVWIFPEMGVAGAALGTAISRLIGSLLGWGALLSGRFRLRVSLGQLLGFDIPGMKEILTIGIPAAFQGFSRNISNILLVAILARTAAGMVAVSAFTVGSNLNQYALMPGLAVGTAAAALTGINLGAGDTKRAEQSGWAAAWIGVGIMTFFSVTAAIFARPLLTFFNPDPAMVEVGTAFIRIIAVAEPFHALGIIFTRSMQGAGYTLRPFLITVFSWVLIRVPLAWFLAFGMGWQQTGVWVAFAFSLILTGVLTLLEYRRGMWKAARISKKKESQTA